MKNKKVIIGVIIAIVVLVVIAVGAFGYYRIQQENLLIEEVNAIVSSNILEDEIDMTIKSKGNYAKVEKTIKEYLNEYVSKVKKAEEIYMNKEVINALSAENCESDGPEFTKTKETVKTAKETANNYVNDLTNYLEKDTMLARIEEQNLSQYYVDLYAKLMYDDEETMKDLQEAKEEMIESNDDYVEMLGKIEEAMNLLSENKDSWKLNNGRIEFTSISLLTKYNNIVRSIK